MPMDQAPQSIKTEIGTYKRLPTFRSPRDLKLSQFQNVPASGQSAADGRPKKVFVPNLNASRLRNSENRTLNSQNVAESPKNDSANTARRESRGRRGGDERGRGRGRRPPREFIQQTGVFSQGLAPSMKTSSWNSSKYDSSPSVPAKPKLKANVGFFGPSVYANDLYTARPTEDSGLRRWPIEYENKWPLPTVTTSLQAADLLDNRYGMQDMRARSSNAVRGK
ncbi:unnamed protein product, partial [Nesidiocoris tenuis]